MLTICTFNIQNDFNDYNISKRDKIINLLKNNHIDIYNLQEVYNSTDEEGCYHVYSDGEMVIYDAGGTIIIK